MPKGKKGFSSGAENHRYRHVDLGGQSAAGAGAAAYDVGAGADAAACDEGAPAKRPRDGDSAAAGHAGHLCALPSCDVLQYNEQVVTGAGGAEVYARRSFVALYVPSVVGTKWPELVLPGGSSVVPAAVFNWSRRRVGRRERDGAGGAAVGYDDECGRDRPRRLGL
jgi:hypothetical protein